MVLPETSRPTLNALGFDDPIRVQFETFLDEHRFGLWTCMEGLTEDQARRRLVPSKSTLLGIVKHATFVERVWFGEAISCRTRDELGLVATADDSFDLTDEDTIESVLTNYVAACEASRAAASSLGIDDIVMGNRRGPLPMRWVYLHVLREIAQHEGHADILREIILSS